MGLLACFPGSSARAATRHHLLLASAAAGRGSFSSRPLVDLRRCRCARRTPPSAAIHPTITEYFERRFFSVASPALYVVPHVSGTRSARHQAVDEKPDEAARCRLARRVGRLVVRGATWPLALPLIPASVRPGGLVSSRRWLRARRLPLAPPGPRGPGPPQRLRNIGLGRAAYLTSRRRPPSGPSTDPGGRVGSGADLTP